jgi:hypothetical protein
MDEKIKKPEVTHWFSLACISSSFIFRVNHFPAKHLLIEAAAIVKSFSVW